MDLADLAPAATLLVGVLALFVGLRTIRQRDLADRRDAWWDRARWAADLTLADDEHRRELGYLVLDTLARSRLAGPEELDLLDVALTHELGRRPDLLDDGWAPGDTGGDGTDDGTDDGTGDGTGDGTRG